jgi:ActR/RegA family two-component response regulator
MVSRAHRLGCSAYLTKPTTAAEILEMTGVRPPTSCDSSPPLTLQDAASTYIVGILKDAGTIAEAARRLRLHKRSLRRMLGDRLRKGTIKAWTRRAARSTG